MNFIVGVLLGYILGSEERKPEPAPEPREIDPKTGKTRELDSGERFLKAMDEDNWLP
jgi:hypothetical protein